MRYWKICFTMLAVLSLTSCFVAKYQTAASTDGNLTFIDSQGGKVYYVNKSGSITDVVDLALSAQSVEAIRADKEKRDAAQKNRDMGQQPLSGTKFTLSLRTRYYKDRLLYVLAMEPFDETAVGKATTVRVDLLDSFGFTLENIQPAGWYSMVDAKGVKIRVEAAGSLPMTLDNFLEVSTWGASWRF
jgi:hypothetical protein